MTSEVLLQGRYRILERSGVEGAIQAYVAQDTYSPGIPKCAIKLLRQAYPEPLSRAKAAEAFEQLAIALEQLGDLGSVPRLLDRSVREQEFWLVREFFVGQPISASMATGRRWPQARVIQLLYQGLWVLEQVHKRGVLHQAIRPDRMLWQPDGTLAVVDFEAMPLAQMQQLAAAGEIGKPASSALSDYTAPEQEVGKAFPSSDLYAVGLIGIQALTGQTPSQLGRDSRGEWVWFNQLPVDRGIGDLVLPMGSVGGSGVEAVWQDGLHVSPELVKFLSTLVRRDPEQRFQTAAEALQVLQQLASPGTWATAAKEEHKQLASDGAGASGDVRQLTAGSGQSAARTTAKPLPSKGGRPLERKLPLVQETVSENEEAGATEFWVSSGPAQTPHEQLVDSLVLDSDERDFKRAFTDANRTVVLDAPPNAGRDRPRKARKLGCNLLLAMGFLVATIVSLGGIGYALRSTWLPWAEHWLPPDVSKTVENWLNRLPVQIDTLVPDRLPQLNLPSKDADSSSPALDSTETTVGAREANWLNRLPERLDTLLPFLDLSTKDNESSSPTFDPRQTPAGSGELNSPEPGSALPSNDFLSASPADSERVFQHIEDWTFVDGVFPVERVVAPGKDTAEVTTASNGAGVQLDVRVLEQGSWMSVMADGQVAYQGNLPAGARRSWSAQESLWVRIGNAGATSISVNGVELGRQGELGQVRELVFQ
jgi:serine/threonine-protein kinase